MAKILYLYFLCVSCGRRNDFQRPARALLSCFLKEFADDLGFAAPIRRQHEKDVYGVQNCIFIIAFFVAKRLSKTCAGRSSTSGIDQDLRRGQGGDVSGHQAPLGPQELQGYRRLGRRMGCAHAGADRIPVPDRGIRGAAQGPGVCRRVVGALWGAVEALKGRAGANPVQELLAVPP